MQRFFFRLIGVALVIASSGCGRSVPGVPIDPVPGQVPEPYRVIYRELESELSQLNPILAAPGGRKSGPTAFGVELLVANSNRGADLLNAQVLQATTLTLDRLKQIGVKSVSLSIQYPILTRSFPETPAYREFYRKVAAEVRQHGLLLVVEMGTMFREPEFSRVPVDYKGLTRDVFNAGLREMAETVIADIHPDYLTVLSEPDTLARNTGLAFSASQFAATVTSAVRGVDPGSTWLGAGAGTWIALDYFKALADIPELNYLDLHIYPIQHGFASNRVLRATEAAKARGKRVAIGEAWLYKVSNREFGRINPVEAFARDAYSFWQPLDERFVATVANLAHTIQAEFCSFFWMNLLYAYVDYTPETSRLAPAQLMQVSRAAAAEKILAGTLSGTGERFKNLIAP
ncbi:MAG: hypothetical protein EHM29_00235 [Desulfobacteraceae bacterium]|jgi:hypothetical protein|nr:MAG: hypothetical protein EHM29_00235 [Desulfobacteraceae bacterium]